MTFWYTFLIMLTSWIILSGRFDLFHLTLGIISCLLVAKLSSNLIFTNNRKKGRLTEAFRFISYMPWLLWQVFIANISIAYLAIHPKMMDKIDPQILWFKSGLKDDIALVTLGNSITLTPGTITVRIIGGEYYVHSIYPSNMDMIIEEMVPRVASIFREQIADG